MRKIFTVIVIFAILSIAFVEQGKVKKPALNYIAALKYIKNPTATDLEPWRTDDFFKKYESTKILSKPFIFAKYSEQKLFGKNTVLNIAIDAKIEESSFGDYLTFTFLPLSSHNFGTIVPAYLTSDYLVDFDLKCIDNKSCDIKRIEDKLKKYLRSALVRKSSHYRWQTEKELEKDINKMKFEYSYNHIIIHTFSIRKPCKQSCIEELDVLVSRHKKTYKALGSRITKELIIETE